MTNEEKLKYLEMLRRQQAAQRDARILDDMLSTRRRTVMHQIYREMGFEVHMDAKLARDPFTEVKCKFSEVDKDFYERD